MLFKARLLLKSLRFQLGLGFIVIILPLIAFLIYTNVYTTGVVRNQVSLSYEDLMTVYMGQVDRSLEEVDNYLYNLAAQETDLLSFEIKDTKNNQEYNMAKIRLSNKLQTDLGNYKVVDLLFIYTITNDDLLITYDGRMTYESKTEVTNEILNIMRKHMEKNASPQKKWQVYKINNNYFFYHFVQVGEVYVGSWVSSNKLMSQLGIVDLGERGVTVLATDLHEPMDKSAFILENNIDLNVEPNSYRLQGNKDKFLVVGAKSKKGNFSLFTLIPDGRILEKIPYLQRIIYLTPIGALLIIFTFVIVLRKIILRPIYRIVTAMRRIKDGYWDSQIATYSTSNEFMIMNETFNGMISQVQKLKIDIYEEQLNNQRAELKNLQLQINPHFFLNSLNIIYHMVQVKKYSLIQEMSQCLVEYFRFMFRSNMTFVTLEDEVKHTNNYLRIQEMRFPGNLTYQIELPDSLKRCQSPPLLVQTFVENSVKYAMTLEKPTHISVKITESISNRQIKIIIQDTGKGFPAEVLEQLNLSNGLMNDQGEHIGIWNVQRRLTLLYGNEASIQFSNVPDSGAVVELRVPYQK
jgi:two-component system sensor histidine kinase YesM